MNKKRKYLLSLNCNKKCCRQLIYHLILIPTYYVNQIEIVYFEIIASNQYDDYDDTNAQNLLPLLYPGSVVFLQFKTYVSYLGYDGGYADPDPK